MVCRMQVIIVGDEHYGDPFRKKVRATSALLVREPKNRHDRNAVGVWVKRMQVGYLSAYQAARFARAIDAAGGKATVAFTSQQGRGHVEIPDEWASR